MKRIHTIITAAVLLSALAGCSASRQTASSEKRDLADKSQLSTEEIVSDGYSETSKYTNTGSVSRAVLSENDQVSFTSTADYIASKISGVDIGADGGLIIRGIGTFNGSTEPLVFIDGVEAMSVEDIIPSEIATVDVVKDGSTAIYGVRGSNGVILITSKAAQHAKDMQREQERLAKEAAKKAREEARKARKANKDNK